jgi:hypothetical protein
VCRTSDEFVEVRRDTKSIWDKQWAALVRQKIDPVEFVPRVFTVLNGQGHVRVYTPEQLSSPKAVLAFNQDLTTRLDTLRFSWRSYETTYMAQLSLNQGTLDTDLADLVDFTLDEMTDSLSALFKFVAMFNLRTQRSASLAWQRYGNEAAMELIVFWREFKERFVRVIPDELFERAPEVYERQLKEVVCHAETEAQT